MVLSRLWTTAWDQVFTVVAYFCPAYFIIFFHGLTLQKFIDVIFSSLDYCSLQNLSKALPSVNYRPAAQFFPFSVFCFPRSVFCMNESMAAAEGQSRLTLVITTKQTNTQSWWLIGSKSTFNLHVYWKSRLIFNSYEIPVCSTPLYSPTPQEGGGGNYCQVWGT